LLAAAADDDADVAGVEELALDEQAVRASAHAPASPAIRRILLRRSIRVMGPSLNRASVRGLSSS
jgi:hypothetical protein